MQKNFGGDQFLKNEFNTHDMSLIRSFSKELSSISIGGADYCSVQVVYYIKMH